MGLWGCVRGAVCVKLKKKKSRIKVFFSCWKKQALIKVFFLEVDVAKKGLNSEKRP